MVTTKEFIKEVEKLGLNVDHRNPYIYIQDGGKSVAIVDADNLYALTLIKGSLERAEYGADLYYLIHDYATTPVDERRNDQRFALKCPLTDMYLNIKDNAYVWSEGFDSQGAEKVFFTATEIRNLPQQKLIETLIREEI